MARLMKDSGIEWIGEIPEEWSVYRAKYLFQIGDGALRIGPFGSALSGKALAEGPYKIYNQAHLVSNDFSLCRHFVSEETYQDLQSYEVAPGDILFSMMGTIGKCRVMPAGQQRGIMDSHLLKARLNDLVIPRFFEYAYDKDLSPIGIGQLSYFSNGSIMAGLNSSIVKNVFFPLPSIAEQYRIAAFLDRQCAEIDAVIERTKATIEEYKKLKQAVITEAVTKGVRGARKMKDSGIEWIGEIPEEWEIKVAFQLFQQIKCKNEGTIEQNLLSLSYGKIKRKSIDTVGGLLPESFDGYNIIEANDIVLRLTDLQNDQTSLRVGLSHERGIVTSAYLTLRNQSKNLPLYLYYYLHSFDVCKGFYGMGAGVRQGLNWDGLKLLKIVLPPIDEQCEITDYLENKAVEIDTLISKKTALLTELETYKKSLIYEYVTGKKECPAE